MTWAPPRWLLVGVLFLLLGAIWLYPVLASPMGIPHQPGMEYSDLTISHIPNALFLKRSLQTWNQVPLWNPTFLSGAPFAADPLAGLWYPPTWLAVLLPAALAFNLLSWLHIAWSGLGTWWLLRSENVGVSGAIVGGVVFSGFPKLMGHVGLGHVTLIFALSWTPWLLYAVGNMVRATKGDRSEWLRRAALAGGLLALVFLADVRWLVPAGLLAGAYGLRIAAHSHAKGSTVVAASGVALLFALLLAAGLALPLTEFVSQSTRADLSASDLSGFSIPWSRLVGLIVPDLGGYGEWTLYAGLGALMLALVAVLARAGGAIFWLGVSVVALVYALGEQTPFFNVLVQAIPGLSLLRVPTRSLFLYGFSISMLAGLAVDWLVQASHQAKAIWRVRLGLMALAMIALLFQAMYLTIGGGLDRERGIPLVLIVMILVLAYVWLNVILSRSIPQWAILIGIVVLIGSELALVNGTMLDVWDSDETTWRSEEIVRQVLDLGSQGRLLSTSHSLPEVAAAEHGLEVAEGVNPLQLAIYRDYMAAAIGFSTQSYSVTLPPFPSGDPGLDWGPQIDSGMLGLLSVSHVVSGFPISATGLELMGTSELGHVYRNKMVRPRAWLEPFPGKAEWDPVEIDYWSPNRISLKAEGPGQLVLSEITYPGWVVRVDGIEASLGQSHGLLRAVELRSGAHDVVFTFRPWTVIIGAALSGLALIGLIVIWMRP